MKEIYYYLMDYKGEIFHESTDKQSVEILCSRLNKRLEDEFDDNGGMGNDPFFYVAYVPDMDYGKINSLVSGILEPFKSRFVPK